MTGYMNWLSPKAVPRPTDGKGHGSFAVAAIRAGETVAAFGGYVMTGERLGKFDEDRQSRSMQIDDDLYLVSAPTAEPGDYINHSCNPNCGIVGSVLVVAMRDIAIGEELSFDYAMADASDYDEFTCKCAAKNCRGVVTGKDWQDLELQEKHRGWFSSYLERRISGIRHN